ncbi:MAG: DUF4230 domain-containing protein [Flavobacteriaceae bacterium]|jgi:hypothetical protein|nr:DUF4230 domain-containing protein [Flavobacteriaceae bacterium]
MNLKKYIIPVIFLLTGVFIASALFKCGGKNEKTVEDTQIINHEIRRLNKMIVIEQNYSAFRTKKYADFNIKYLDFLNKNIVLYITAKAQVTYDMKQMKIEIDSVDKKIHIVSIPEPELNVYPNVEIYSMEEGLFNNFSKAELNQVMNEGKDDICKEVEKSSLKALAHNQLISNLRDLYTMAKLYHWQIVDDTPYAKELQTVKD